MREAARFFHRAAYRVGPYRFSLNEIEHGLLRNNRPALPGAAAALPAWRSAPRPWAGRARPASTSP
ncbi:MAG: DUF547 domain-containing protein [Dehalococcoidia bacterium]